MGCFATISLYSYTLLFKAVHVLRRCFPVSSFNYPKVITVLQGGTVVSHPNKQEVQRTCFEAQLYSFAPIHIQIPLGTAKYKGVSNLKMNKAN